MGGMGWVHDTYEKRSLEVHSCVAELLYFDEQAWRRFCSKRVEVGEITANLVRFKKMEVCEYVSTCPRMLAGMMPAAIPSTRSGSGWPRGG